MDATTNANAQSQASAEGPSRTGTAVFTDRSGDEVFTNPKAIIEARSPSEVTDALAQVRDEVARGHTAACFVAYEAAPAFEPKLAVHPADVAPLAWFGIYDEPSGEQVETHAYDVGPWTPRIDQPRYESAIARIREWIADGDTYQVNFTFPMDASFSGDPLAWYRTLYEAQPTDYAAYIDTGRFQVLSMSPELFFGLDGDRLVTRPMKGTRPRGRWRGEDEQLARDLVSSEKDRAENVMIVDLLRNDMGRVSRTGSVRVPSLFEVERYDTVWQMTSTIKSRTDADVPEILAALFPSGSVTGAPKVRTMEIVRDLECGPRGVYCGAVGWWRPGRRARFNVAIRTVLVDADQGTARYHVGGGITWGSTPEGEYDECLTKAAVLARHAEPFQLLESLLHDGDGYFLLDYHLDRLTDSARYFGYAVDLKTVRTALAREAASLDDGAYKVRLLVNCDGAIHVESDPATPARPLRVGFARAPVDSRDVFLFHKTTRRQVYDSAKASRPECDDVLLWNERGEVTESSSANVAVRIDGQWYTPPVSCGLLGGTMRRHLLDRGDLEERPITKDEALRADAGQLLNSVRKKVNVTLID
ncbi:MAG: aminodeoxychorismate synthase component I [bacterium]|nr:aminodeoxychorismate synthase component I [bacterium]